MSGGARLTILTKGVTLGEAESVGILDENIKKEGKKGEKDGGGGGVQAITYAPRFTLTKFGSIKYVANYSSTK